MPLKNKYETYLKLLPSKQDKHGFIESHECDSLLFTGLAGCLPNIDINIEAAFDGELWHRRPLDNLCFDCTTKTDLGSKSSISRDMLLGLAWFCYHNKRLDICEQIIEHAMKNWGFMGCAIDKKVMWGRCQIMPSLFATFCWISYRLGGPKRSWAMWIPADLGYKTDDFQAHLQVLHILLRRDLTHELSNSDRKILEYHYQRSPENPLFCYAVDRISEAKASLEREDFWPSDRLPTRGDRKTQWIMMRDPKDWVPADSDKSAEHSGGDFLFLYWLIFRDVAL